MSTANFSLGLPQPTGTGTSGSAVYQGSSSIACSQKRQRKVLEAVNPVPLRRHRQKTQDGEAEEWGQIKA